MRTILSLFALCVATVPALAQEKPAIGPGVVEASLTARRPIVTPGQPIELTLSVDFLEAAMVPATLLGGRDLSTYLNGEVAAPIREVVDGDVKIAAGTRLERRLTVQTSEAWPGVRLSEYSRVGFEWAGLPDARTSVRVVPDQSDLDLTTLDLEGTKVKLVTSKGDIVLRFFPDKAPKTVENFVKLASSGFYNGTRFHRVLRGFMVQGGCPNTKEGATGIPGTGDPGYRIDAEFNDTRHVRGIVSMARSREPNSAGCQFFMVHGDSSHLDGKYTAFGMVESGLDVLDAIADSPVEPTSRGEPSKPADPIWLHAAVVEPAYK